MQLLSQTTPGAQSDTKFAGFFAWLGTLGALAIFAFLASREGGYFSTTFYPAAIGALTLLGLIILAQWDGFRVPDTSGTPIMALGAVTIWTGVSALWSVSPNLSLQEFARVCIYFATFLAVLSGTAIRRDVKLSAGLLSAMITGVGAFALLAWVLPSYSEQFVYAGGRLMGSIGYWNGLAGLMVMGLIPALWLSSSPTLPRLVRIASCSAMMLMGLTLYLTLSRGGIAVFLLAVALFLILVPDRLAAILSLAAAAVPGALVAIYAANSLPSLRASGNGILILAGDGNKFALALAVAFLAAGALKAATLLAPSRVPASRGGRIFIAVCCALIVLALAGLAIGQRTAISDRISQLTSSSEEQAWDYGQPTVDTQGPERLTSISDNRTEFWRIGLQNFSENPLLGTGAGTYRFANLRLQSGEGLARDPHSVWVRFLSDQGITGFLLWLAFVLSLCIGVINQLIRRPGLRNDGLYLSLLIAALAWLVDSSFEWNWALPAVTLPFFILVALALRLGASSEAEEQQEDDGLPRKRLREDTYVLPAWMRLSALLLALIVTMAFLALMASVMFTGNARDSLADDDLAIAEADAARAHRLNPWAVEPSVILAHVRSVEGDQAEAENYLLDAIDREPEKAVLYELLAKLEFYELKQTDQGLNDLTRAIDLDPENIQLQILLHRMLRDAEIYESSGSMPAFPDIWAGT